MPETSYLKRALDLPEDSKMVQMVQSFKESFRKISLEKLALILDKQKRIKEFI